MNIGIYSVKGIYTIQLLGLVRVDSKVGQFFTMRSVLIM